VPSTTARAIVADEWPIGPSKHGISKRRKMASVADNAQVLDEPCAVRFKVI
jgi:hypothetical protein